MRYLEVEKKKKSSLPFLQEKRQLETSLSEEKQGVIDSPDPDDDEKTTSMTVVQMQTLMPMRTHIDDEIDSIPIDYFEIHGLPGRLVGARVVSCLAT